MADMPIRDVPDDIVAALEARARRLSLSRSEYVRRRLAQDAAVADSPASGPSSGRLRAVSRGRRHRPRSGSGTALMTLRAVLV